MSPRPNVRMLAQAATTMIWLSRSVMLEMNGQLSVAVVSDQLSVVGRQLSVVSCSSSKPRQRSS
jgi:hypothetical protein